MRLTSFASEVINPGSLFCSSWTMMVQKAVTGVQLKENQRVFRAVWWLPVRDLIQSKGLPLLRVQKERSQAHENQKPSCQAHNRQPCSKAGRARLADLRAAGNRYRDREGREDPTPSAHLPDPDHVRDMGCGLRSKPTYRRDQKAAYRNAQGRGQGEASIADRSVIQ